MSDWEFWIDRGGTFTDLVARDPTGRLRHHKLLSELGSGKDAAVEGIRALIGLDASDTIPTEDIAAIKMGTTVATNALLERQGVPVALITNRGHEDALSIGYQTRPELFNRQIIKPEMLYERVYGIAGRISATGEELEALDIEAVQSTLRDIKARGIASIAIVLMHNFRFPAHERAVAEAARELGFEQISTSHETSGLIKFISRGDTTVMDAYLSPILTRYVQSFIKALGGARTSPKLQFMMSSGGLTDARLFKGKDAVLSGPAGGVIGMVETSREHGSARVIGFDMGGTSTDVSHFAGELERVFETEVAGVRVRAPMMHIHTIAAGGGSLLRFDGARLRVGPDSAGASPGPMCYRRGGPLALTDANLLLGKILPQHFPRVFGESGSEPIDLHAVQQAFAKLASQIGDGKSAHQVAEGFVRIAVEHMARAIEKISTQRGHDVTSYLLNCFGGAGGQHACQVADALGMKEVLLHPLAGVLSAYGMGRAKPRAHREQAINEPFGEDLASRLASRFESLARATRNELANQGIEQRDMTTERRLHLRYAGTDTALVVAEAAHDLVRRAFLEAHRARFGFISTDKEIVIEAIEVESHGASSEINEPLLEAGEAAAEPLERARFFSQGAFHDAPVVAREHLRAGQRLDGPAIIVEPIGTIVVEPGWRAEVNPRGHINLHRTMPMQRSKPAGTRADPILLEIFNNLFMSIAEQMGLVLQATADSVNIKERLDFSCAIFNAKGALVANAPHLPVHLGSMDRSVESIIRHQHGRFAAGDAFVINAPYDGGTHLPDITVVTPVFDRGQRRPLFFVASRGHHADIGGLSPGSASPAAKLIHEEGAYIECFQLVKQGEFDEAGISALLTGGEFPARNPAQNIADLKAQVAANERGASELLAMVDHYGLKVVHAYMRHVQDNAAETIRRAIASLRESEFILPMDAGRNIRVALRPDADSRSLIVDFAGTSAEQPDNFNAPAPVTRAVVLYCFRALVDTEIPMNAGCLEPIDIRIPERSMLSPEHPAAVVAGNTEVSQALANAIFGALGVNAASQGTMNNFIWGDESYQNYETLCGGTGAGIDNRGEGFHGASAVHSHMTNTKLTDPEVLESRFPVRLERFEIRRGSGGEGRFRGGDGVSRVLRFLRPMEVNLLTGSREVPPFGLAGGSAGALGVNQVLRADGRVESLEGCARVFVEAGDAIRIKTPGGGGFGQALAP